MSASSRTRRRGRDDGSDGLFSYVRLSERIPADHPLRPIKALADEALALLNQRFEGLCSSTGRPSIPPETLLRATLLEAEVAREFLAALLGLAQVRKLLSNEHFSVDGTLIDAWASMKSFRPKDGSGEPPSPGRNGERNFRQEKRSNETHASTTVPDARLYRKADGHEIRLCFMGHVLMENRNGLAVAGVVTRHRDRRTRGGTDHGRSPRIALNGTLSKHGVVRKTAVDRRTTRHAGYRVSQILRKRIEEVLGWIKAQAGVDQIKVRGLAKAEAVFIYAVAAYNLIRIPKLLAAPP